MRVLYHHWLSPSSRTVRLVLHEKRLDVTEHVHYDWHNDEDFLALNPAGVVPVVVEPDGSVFADDVAIVEYLEEAYPDHPLLPHRPAKRAEARRLASWFRTKFMAEVGTDLIREKLFKRLLGQGGPDSRAVRTGQANLRVHLDYIAWLTERRNWLAGEQLTIADLTAAAHISLIDYVGDIPWEEHPLAKDWYARIKSRPCFRPLLRDTIPGIPPTRHYANLDF